jgi:hypothetical protein
MPTGSTSHARVPTSTCPSAGASTTASAPPSYAWRASSRSAR